MYQVDICVCTLAAVGHLSNAAGLSLLSLLARKFDALAGARKLNVVTFQDWKKIEVAEASRARDGAPREKFVDVAEMIHARD